MIDNRLTQAHKVLKLAVTDLDAADDAYARLIELFHDDERAACRLLVNLECADWPDSLIEEITDFAYQRCWENGDEALRVVMETIGFAQDMREKEVS